MLYFIFFAGLAALAGASPLNGQASYPDKDRSQGFRLVVNVTGLDHDFSPSIQHTYITAIHTGAAQNLLGIGEQSSSRIFYVNGTTTEYLLGQATTQSDGSLPPTPFGYSLRPDFEGSAMSTAHLDAGPGDKGYVLTRFPVPYVFLAPEQMAICYESIPYYGGRNLHIVKNLNLNINKTLPGNCAPVRLIAECADLGLIPVHGPASHDYAYDSECYKSVKMIDWTQYGPW
jgi:hypothetical protein